jgi:hypothetical protein
LKTHFASNYFILALQTSTDKTKDHACFVNKKTSLEINSEKSLA